MNIIKKTEIGNIIITEGHILGIIEDVLKRPMFNGKVWYAEKAGVSAVIQSLNVFTAQSQPVKIENSDNKEDVIKLVLPIIIKFGESISFLTDELSVNLKSEIEEKLDLHIEKIIFKIVGVRSRKTAKRSIEIIKTYEIR